MAKMKELSVLLKELLDLGYYTILIPKEELDEEVIIVEGDIDSQPN